MEQRKYKILVIDDEDDLREILLFNLEAAGFSAHAVESGEEAIKVHPEDFDLVLLDVMMEGMSGFELAKEFRNTPRTRNLPIIFLTAKDSREDALIGLGLGADDYVTKPFSIKELILRIKAVLRRTYEGKEPQGNSSRQDSTTLGHNIVSIGGLTIDETSKIVSTPEGSLSLTKTEFEVLSLLLSSPGRVFSREEILQTAWPSGVIVTRRSVDVTITRLRHKLGPYGDAIVTRTGWGYCYEGGSGR